MQYSLFQRSGAVLVNGLLVEDRVEMIASLAGLTVTNEFKLRA